jgi:acyl phosphate:glycerol-3-phosphate acyltransferase
MGNKYLLLALSSMVSYFVGTILFAYIVTRIATKQDIRDIGNTNPGTSNVTKNVGALAGVITGILDISKALILIIIARIFLFTGETFFDWISLYLVGMFVILGHCRPFWMGFKKGGGGMGSAVGVCAFFTPVEFGISMLIGIFIVYTFMKDANYKFGRWVMMFAAAFHPFIVLIFNKLVFVKLFSHISFGGHNIGIVVGGFLLLTELLILNSHELKDWLKNPASDTVSKRGQK